MTHLRHNIMTTLGALAIIIAGAWFFLGPADDTEPVQEPRPPQEVTVTKEELISPTEESDLQLFWPKVTHPDKTMEQKIAQVLDFEAIVGDPIEHVIKTYDKCQCGVVGSDFAILLEREDVLSLRITYDFYGAYPSTFTHYFSFNLDTGELFTADDLFQNKKALVALLDETLQQHIADARAEYGPTLGDYDVYDKDFSFTTDHLDDFVILDIGIQFNYEFGFPHVYKAAEPESTILLSYEKLDPYLLRSLP